MAVRHDACAACTSPHLICCVCCCSAVILMESNLGMTELEELLTRMGDRSKVGADPVLLVYDPEASGCCC